MNAGASMRRTVVIDGNPEPVRGMRAMLASFLRDRCVSESVSRAIVLAFSEALDNAMEHGLPDSRGEIVVRIRYSPRFILVSLRDSGGDQAPLGVVVPVSDDDERGRGFRLMNELMDYVRVRTYPGGGTRVSMLRRLDRSKDARA